MDELRVAFRAAHFAAAVALFGEFAFFFWVARPAFRHASQAIPLELYRRLHQVTAWSLAVVVASGVAWFLLQAAAMSGAAVGAMQPDTLDAVLTRTLFGRVWQIRFGLAIALGVVLLLLRRAVDQRNRAVLRGCSGFLAGALLATLAWAGHAAAEQGADRIAHLAADAVHLLAAGAWLGALAPLAYVLSRARQAANSEAYELAVGAAQRFSALGIASVSALMVTGTVNAWYTVGSLPALVGTHYGRLLLVKLALFGAMLALAAFNRFRVTSRLAQEAAPASRDSAPRALRQLQRNAIAEAMLGLGLLAVVGALGIAVPASHVQPVWPFAYSLSLEAAENSAGTLAAASLAMLGATISLALILIGAARRWRKTTLAAAAGLSIGLAASAWLFAVPAYPTSYFRSPIRYTAESIVRGKVLFEAHCAVCHGPSGRGDGPAAGSLAVKPRDLAEHFFHHREGDILWKLKHGVAGTPMPGFGDRLDDDQLWHLINLLRAQAQAVEAQATNESVEPWRAIVAPDFTFQVGRGPQDSLARQRGRIVLLAFYTLPGSYERLRTLAQAKAALEHADVRIIALPIAERAGTSQDAPEIDASILANADPRVVVAYGIFNPALRSRHTELLIDRQGYLRARWRLAAGEGWNRIPELLRQVELLHDEKPRAMSQRTHAH